MEGSSMRLLRNVNRGGGHSQLTCGEKAVSQVLYGNVITHLLRNLEYVIKRSRTMCAMTGLNILPSLLWESVSEGQESGLLQKRMSLFNDSKESRYDIESSCKTQVAGAAATLPKRTYLPSKRAAFTLAEVLITIGIIGIVAAMTMPSLIANYRKKQTAVRLERFYSIMSQAVLRWQQDEGIMPEDIRFPAETAKNGVKTQEWFSSTIGKYITTTYQTTNGQNFSAAFNDGSGFDSYIGNENQFFIFYCIDYKYCTNANGDGNFNGKTGFLFEINRGRFLTSSPDFDNKTREEILESCKYRNRDDQSVSSKGRRHACTRLIQMDGWKIRKDYPWEQTMLEN